MNWKLSMLGVCLLVFQTEHPAEKPAREGDPIVVTIGHVPMEGVWYQDGVSHAHDNQVRLKPAYHKNGILTIDVATYTGGGTDLTFYFSHDANGATRVRGIATYRHDGQNEESPVGQNLKELSGRMMLRTNDWGPGKDLTCLFALEGKLEKEPQFLLGSFLIVIPQ